MKVNGLVPSRKDYWRKIAVTHLKPHGERYRLITPGCSRMRANLSGVQLTSIAVLLGLTGSGLLFLKIGGWYFEHKRGPFKSVGAATTLIGFTFLIVALAIVWVVRIRHLLR